MSVETTHPKRTRSAPDLLALALAASLVAIFGLLARPAFESRMYTRDDLGRSAIPMRHFYAQRLTQGDRPYWWPDIWCGFYLHAETMVGMCHPWHLLLYRYVPFVAAFNLDFLANYALMLVGMALFLRRWGLGAPAALLGAGLYTFVGFNLLHYIHVAIEPAGAHLPFLVLAVDGVMRGRGARSVGLSALGLAALTTSNILLSSPPGLWICGLVGVGYAALLSPAVDRGARRLALVLAAHGIGILGGAVQLLPTYRLMQESQRASVSSRFLAHGSTHPVNWVVQPLAPYLYRAGVLQYPEVVANATFDQPLGPALDRDDNRTWENGVYGGAVLPALLTWLVIRRRGLGRLRPLVVAAVALAALGIVLSVGRYLPLFEVTRRLPGFRFFREPGRYVLLAHFAMPALAAVAFDDLCRVARDRLGGAGRSLWPLAIVALLAIVVPVGIRALGRVYPKKVLPEAMALRRYDAVGVLLVGGAAGLVALAARGRRAAAAGLALLAVADMGFYVWNNFSDVPREDIETIARSCTPPIRPPDGFGERTATGREYRLSLAGEEQFDNGPTMRGIKYTEGYASFRPRRRLDYHATAALRLAGAAWVNRRPYDEADWEPVPDPLPRARLVSRARASSDPKGDLPGIDPATTALVEAELDLPGGPPGHARILSDRPGSIAVATDAPSRQLLVLSESFFDGWKVGVDGGPPSSALRVYGDFIGCVVEGGSHRVEFTFDPDDLRFGMWISTTVTALIGAGLVILLIRRPRPPSPRIHEPDRHQIPGGS
jgi:hypothetical protein